jgi:hypothetical protein
MNPSTADSVVNPVVLEINVHQTSIDQYEVPDEELHSDFMGAYLKSLAGHTFHGKLRQKLSGENDTVFTYDEIPLIRETRSKILVYADGTSETQLEDLTPEGVNPLYNLTETPPESKHLLSKTLLKEGHLKVYNKHNELLIDELYPEYNMKEFLDSLQYYVQFGGNSPKRMPLSGIDPIGLNRLALSDGTVLLEQQLGVQPSGVEALHALSPIKAVAVMNDEMTRTLRFELHGHDQLLHRKVFEYEDSYLLTNYVNGKEFSSNPRSIESMTLQLSKEGNPVIYRSKTFYHSNQSVLKMNGISN